MSRKHYPGGICHAVSQLRRVASFAAGRDPGRIAEVGEDAEEAPPWGHRDYHLIRKECCWADYSIHIL